MNSKITLENNPSIILAQQNTLKSKIQKQKQKQIAANQQNHKRNKRGVLTTITNTTKTLLPQTTKAIATKNPKKKIHKNSKKEQEKIILKKMNEKLEEEMEEEISIEKEEISPQKSLPEDVIDVNEKYANNIQFVTEFIEEIMDHKFETEKENKISPNYLSTTQTKISTRMRAVLLDWLIEVHLKFKLLPDTLYLTRYIIDKFLSLENLSISKLQLLGVTSMLIASKYEEIYPPEVGDFVYICDGAFNKEDILKMESIILNLLKFDLSYVTPLFFAKRFLRVLDVNLPSNEQDLRYDLLTNYFIEMTVPEIQMLDFCSSKIAASALYLSIQTLDQLKKSQNHQGKIPQDFPSQNLWNPTIQYFTKYSENDLFPCIQEMHKIASKISTLDSANPNNLISVRKKYSHTKYSRVALIPICKL
ncbi:cyclin-a1-1 [Anaeramoeba ignava]|uniref:Cyclin-a1-1 n=1 Tax=Anaeramoeba ignava TaxID=1746090 RepID=A0A9Q0LG02_ANAIG|nr:cyclin-a1-1 [Anaeramoeba ignava]